MIAGPGNRYVQEAKRQLAGEVGIDGIAGPSELMVIAGDTANADWMALDLCAQAEHGPDGLLVAAAVETVILDAIEESVARIAEETGIDEDAPLALVAIPETETGVALANAIAPEHLEILTEDAELLTQRVTTAGCVFVGEPSATAFGDYAAGSNHVLPTGGTARHTSGLSVFPFLRLVNVIECDRETLAATAPLIDALGGAEDLAAHVEAVRVRVES